MSRQELREMVMKQYQEGQKITLKIKGETRAGDRTVEVTIDHFYPAHVSVKHKSYYESYSYLDFIKMVNAKEVPPEFPEIRIPDSIKIRKKAV